MESHLSSRGMLMALVVAGVLGVAGTSDASYQDYLKSVMSDPQVRAAGLVGAEGRVWADQGTGVKETEIRALAEGAADKSKFASGIVVGDANYMYLDSVALSHGTMHIGRSGGRHVVVEASNKAVVVALTKEGANPMAVTKVDALVGDLKSKGF